MSLKAARLYAYREAFRSFRPVFGFRHKDLFAFSILWPTSQRLPASGANVRHQTRRAAMAYISPIAIETALRSLDEMVPEAIRHNQATEAAHVLLATSRRHARRFALA